MISGQVSALRRRTKLLFTAPLPLGETFGLVLFRWDAPLFFANAEFFSKQYLTRWQVH